MNPGTAEIMAANIKLARETFDEMGTVPPTFVLHRDPANGGSILVRGEFADDKEKGSLLSFIKLLIIKHGITSYSCVFEAWVKSFDKGEEIKGRVQDQPGKQEAVVINYVSHDERHVTYLSIVREGPRAVLMHKLQTALENATGAFFDLLPPKEVMGRAITPENIRALDVLIKLALDMGKVTILKPEQEQTK